MAVTVLNVIKEIWRELNTPDDFAVDWYKWAAGQIGHIGLGWVLVYIAAKTYFIEFSEYPVKELLWLFIAGGYFVYEVAIQGWKGKDTIEDWVFVCLYGAGSALVIHSEVEVGSLALSSDLHVATPVLAIVLAHLFGGVVARIYPKVAKDDN